MSADTTTVLARAGFTIRCHREGCGNDQVKIELFSGHGRSGPAAYLELRCERCGNKLDLDDDS